MATAAAIEELEKRLPQGQNSNTIIRTEDVTTTEGNALPTRFSDDAAATICWMNYLEAKNFLENNSWLLEWQTTDILYQSQTLDRYPAHTRGRPELISRFIVAKNSNTMARKVKRAIFAEKNPFLLRPTGDTTQRIVDAWTELIAALMKRMNFRYHVGRMIDTQTLQGTAIGKMAVEQKTVIRKRRVRKSSPVQINLPVTGRKNVPTSESDEFKIVEDKRTETWPFFEYRKLGTTLFDPKWCTPNRPDLSGKYSIDIDFVTFSDLQQMRELDCYDIPNDETLKAYFLHSADGSAPAGTTIEDNMSNMGSPVTHAAGRNEDTDHNPLNKPVQLIEMNYDRSVITILNIDGRHLLIRNGDADTERDPHVTANWWSIDNSGYGMGIGRMNGGDQRITQGVLNEALKMIAYPMNAPIITARGENAPSQNVIARMGGYMQVDLPQGMNDIRRAIGFLEMPPVPGDAWKMIQFAQQESEDTSGANSTFAQGNLGGPGSSAGRTATGASRISAMVDETILDPVDAIAEGVIVPVIEFLMCVVRERMPLWEIREILKKSKAKIILTAIEEDQFVNAEFDLEVLAGERLKAKQGIAQIIPIILQIFSQPQLLEYLHQRGDTIDFGVIMDLILQMSDLEGQPDIFRPLTDQEMQNVQGTNPAAQRTQASLAVEQQRGKNKIAEIHAKSQDDLANKAAEVALNKTAEGIPFERAAGLVARSNDEAYLRGEVQ